MSKKWFVIHARSGYEAKVKAAIEEAVSREGIEDLVGEIMIPTEQVVELKGGKKRETERKFFPGYMLIKMELTEPSWLLVKNTRNVIGFIGGSSGKPSPITQREVERIFARVQEGADKPKPKVAFQPGEEVLVIDGPFNEFNGTVEGLLGMKIWSCVSSNSCRLIPGVLGRRTMWCPVEKFLSVCRLPLTCNRWRWRMHQLQPDAGALLMVQVKLASFHRSVSLFVVSAIALG